MGTANLTTAADDGARVNRLFEAMAVLTGLEAYAAQEEDGSGVCLSLLQMSRTSRAFINEVILSMDP